MATIQLDQEVLDVERLIDDRNHDEAFRQLILLRDRFGRRPEYRYLKALFDVTFDVRTDGELLVDVRALVGEQPDFLEAVSLLALLLDRTGDRDRAMVFAREAANAANDRARLRARRVLGNLPSNPTADEEPFSRRSSSSMASVRAPESRGESKPRAPTPVGVDARARETREMFTPASDALRAAPPPSEFDPYRMPSKPPPWHETEGLSGDTLDGLPRAPSILPVNVTRPSTMPPPPEPAEGPSLTKTQPSTIPPMLPSEPPGVLRRDLFSDAMPPTKDARALAAETIPFSPADLAMPPPPTIPPDPLDSSGPRPASSNPPKDRTAPTLRGLRVAPKPAEAPPEPSQGYERRPTVDERVGRAERLTDRPPARPASTPLPPPHSVERPGDKARTRPSRPAIAIAAPVQQVRAWFQYARDSQLKAGEGFSTARTLLDLCERVVEGATPLSSDPVPLDRRGLILVEARLETLRGTRAGTQQAAERGAVTAAAAFLMGLLLKECDGRATDTSAEDGACKVVVPSGATVRPLLVAAAFARSRGPGLVETFDRAATAHMRRGPTRRTGASRVVTQDAVEPSRTNDFDLTVLRRDLDASTLGVTDPDTPAAPQPGLDMRKVATEFWSTELGREIMGSSRRVGMFTIADVDAIERYASKTFSAVGFAPPGTPWPWSPSDELDDLILSWGGILGEVLVGLYSGRWEADPGNPEDRQLFRIVISGGVVAWPVAKAYMRLARGIPHDLSVYIDAVGRVVGRQALGSQTWPES